MRLDAAQGAIIGVWAAIYVAGMWISRPDRDAQRRLARWGKVGMIACFVGMAIYGLISRGTAAITVRYGGLILAGLVAGGAGDILLAELTPVKRPLLPAIMAFGLGHLFYTVALIGVAETPLVRQIAVGAALLIWLILLGAGLWQRLNPASCPNLTQLALAAYFVLLASVTLMGVLQWRQSPAAWRLGLGLLLFGISDLLLGADLSGRWRFPLMGDLIWILYASGQMLIALSIWAL